MVSIDDLKNSLSHASKDSEINLIKTALTLVKAGFNESYFDRELKRLTERKDHVDSLVSRKCSDTHGNILRDAAEKLNKQHNMREIKKQIKLVSYILEI